MKVGSGRRRWLLALPVAMLIAVPVVLLAAQRPSAASSTVLTIFTAGAAVSHSSGAFATASDGAILAPGDRVRTDDTGHALVTFFDGSTLELEPATTVQIDAAQPNPDGSIAIELTQSLGRTWASVQKLTKADSKFEVKTPASTATVRGTAFLTEVLPNGQTTVQTSDGTVAVSAQGQTVLVTVGQTTTVQPNQPPAAPSAIPAPSNTLRFGMHSPAHIVVIDPFGRSCGITMPGATIVRQIPGCVTSDPGAEPETVDVPNAIAGTYRTVITEIDPGGAFTLTATALDTSGAASFDLSLAGDGKPGAVFGSSLDVRADSSGRLSASGLAPLTVIAGASPSPTESPSASPSPSATVAATATPAPTSTSSFVPRLTLPALPVSTATPTPAPTATPTASPSPTASASASPSPSPSVVPTVAPSPSALPSAGCVPSQGQPNKCPSPRP